MSERYSEMSDLAAFGFLVNAVSRRRGGGDGDRDSVFPRSDAEDLSRGARFIPGDVTLARRDGRKVNFVTNCGRCCWYWEMPDRSRIYHWERLTYEQIGRANGRKADEDGNFKEGAGPCPNCGNPHTGGGTIKL